mgnify:CR=1 FL=1
MFSRLIVPLLCASALAFAVGRSGRLHRVLAVGARRTEGQQPLPIPDYEERSANVDETALKDDLDALTKRDAADETPGVSQVRQSFQVIFLLYGLVVPFVTGLFFLILTFQKANALTLLNGGMGLGGQGGINLLLSGL